MFMRRNRAMYDFEEIDEKTYCIRQELLEEIMLEIIEDYE